MVYNNTHVYEGRPCRAEQVVIDRLETKKHIHMTHINTIRLGSDVTPGPAGGVPVDRDRKLGGSEEGVMIMVQPTHI